MPKGQKLRNMNISTLLHRLRLVSSLMYLHIMHDLKINTLITYFYIMQWYSTYFFHISSTSDYRGKRDRPVRPKRKKSRQEEIGARQARADVKGFIWQFLFFYFIYLLLTDLFAGTFVTEKLRIHWNWFCIRFITLRTRALPFSTSNF